MFTRSDYKFFAPNSLNNYANLGAHMAEISSFALITRIFLRAATERNTRKRQEVIFARASEALGAR